jgi:hypothetical protein
MGCLTMAQILRAEARGYGPAAQAGQAGLSTITDAKSSGKHESSDCAPWFLIEYRQRPIRAGSRVAQACGNRCSLKLSAYRVYEPFHIDPCHGTQYIGWNNPRLRALEREHHGR